MCAFSFHSQVPKCFFFFFPSLTLLFKGLPCSSQMVKNLPAMQETWVQSLDQEDPLEKDWQPTPVFLPGESHGQRSLVGYSPWSYKESDTTKRLKKWFIFGSSSLHCSAGFSLAAPSRGYSLVMVHGLCTVVVSLVEHRALDVWA